LRFIVCFCRFAYIDFKTKDALKEAGDLKGKLKHRGRKLHLEVLDAESQQLSSKEPETGYSLSHFCHYYT